jgi:hypothetical protein
MRDALGNEVKPGDWITYPVRWSSYLGVKLAYVKSVHKELEKEFIKALPVEVVSDRPGTEEWFVANTVNIERVERVTRVRAEDVPDGVGTALLDFLGVT